MTRSLRHSQAAVLCRADVAETQLVATASDGALQTLLSTPRAHSTPGRRRRTPPACVHRRCARASTPLLLAPSSLHLRQSTPRQSTSAPIHTAPIHICANPHCTPPCHPLATFPTTALRPPHSAHGEWWRSRHVPWQRRCYAPAPPRPPPPALWALAVFSAGPPRCRARSGASARPSLGERR